MRECDREETVDPCSTITCNEDEKCELVQPNCIRAPCNPVPVCKKTSTCVVGGCSGELCLSEKDASNLGVSTCMWRCEFGCYQYASCEVQDDNKCGWTKSQQFSDCIASCNV